MGATATLSTRRARRPLGVVAAGLAIAVVAGVAWRATATNSLPSPGWALTANGVTTDSPTPMVSNLLDGSPVTVNLKANPDVSVIGIQIRQCRIGTYSAATDLSPRSGNCPTAPVSSSADQIIEKAASDGLIGLAQSDAGANLTFRVGAGTTQWVTPTGTASLTCGLGAPCDLVMEVDTAATTTFQTFQLEFTDADPIKACGGTAAGFLHTDGSDALSDAWSGWTRAFCAQHPGGAPSSAAFTGEGSAVTAFEQDANDLAYGSAGIDPASGMLPSGTTNASRNTIAVPIALNAGVLAVGGGFRPGGTGTKQAYPQLQVNVGDAAALLSGGVKLLQDSRFRYASDLLLNNVLGQTPYWSGANVLASSLSLTSTWLLTQYFTAITPQDWAAGQRLDPSLKGTPRGATSNLATATPPFNDTSLLTGKPAMGKQAFNASLDLVDGPLWVFTDSATAASLGLTPVALQDPSGASFVAPNADSMTAAVAGMKAGPSGVLEPTIQATTAASGVGAAATEAYPLTYVEYAFVPAEPLVDETTLATQGTCTARTASQALLTNWLNYVTGPGQQKLPAGLVALPASLQSQATAAIAKVGTAPITGACAGNTVPEKSPGSGSGGGFASSSFPTSLSKSAFGASPSAAAAAAAAANSQGTSKKAAAIAIPAFAGHRIADPWGGVVALVGIVIIMSLAAWITAGGRLSAGGQWTPGSLGALTPARVGSLVLLWSGVGVACLGLVLFQLGPMLEQRDQRSLLSQYRTEVTHAAYETQGLPTTDATTVANAPSSGDPVGILEIPALRLQNVVVEGVTASDTRMGPGHVPGTAGLGQPGNSAVVARRNGYGGAFTGLGHLVRGDRIVATTTQGQTVYAVTKVCSEDLTTASKSGSTSPTSSSSSPSPTFAAAPCSSKPASASTYGPSVTTTTRPTTSTTVAIARTTTTTATTTAGTGTAGAKPSTSSSLGVRSGAAVVASTAGSPVLAVATLYGPTSDDRLTLVTSATKEPWNSSRATIVVARMLTKPYAATPQNARSDSETGMSGDAGAWAAVALAMLGFTGVIVASVALYRKMQFRIAYVLTIAPLVAFTIIAAETIARLLPAWT